MPVTVHMHHLALARQRRARAAAMSHSDTRWPLPFAVLVWVAVSELFWFGVLEAARALN